MMESEMLTFFTPLCVLIIIITFCLRYAIKGCCQTHELDDYNSHYYVQSNPHCRRIYVDEHNRLRSVMIAARVQPGPVTCPQLMGYVLDPSLLSPVQPITPVPPRYEDAMKAICSPPKYEESSASTTPSMHVSYPPSGATTARMDSTSSNEEPRHQSTYRRSHTTISIDIDPIDFVPLPSTSQVSEHAELHRQTSQRQVAQKLVEAQIQRLSELKHVLSPRTEVVQNTTSEEVSSLVEQLITNLEESEARIDNRDQTTNPPKMIAVLEVQLEGNCQSTNLKEEENSTVSDEKPGKSTEDTPTDVELTRRKGSCENHVEEIKVNLEDNKEETEPENEPTANAFHSDAEQSIPIECTKAQETATATDIDMLESAPLEEEPLHEHSIPDADCLKEVEIHSARFEPEALDVEPEEVKNVTHDQPDQKTIEVVKALQEADEKQTLLVDTTSTTPEQCTNKMVTECEANVVLEEEINLEASQPIEVLAEDRTAPQPLMEIPTTTFVLLDETTAIAHDASSFKMDNSPFIDRTKTLKSLVVADFWDNEDIPTKRRKTVSFDDTMPEQTTENEKETTTSSNLQIPALNLNSPEKQTEIFFKIVDQENDLDVDDQSTTGSNVDRSNIDCETGLSDL